MAEGVEERILTKIGGGVRKPARTWVVRIKIQKSTQVRGTFQNGHDEFW